MLSFFVIFIFGLVIGSFLNYVIYRLSIPGYSFYKNFVGPKSRSYCPSCTHTLVWKDLFPLLSYVFLLGKCRYCHKKISIQYPLVEISTALIFLLIFNDQFSVINEFLIFNFKSFINLLFLFYISSVLIIIFVYDLKYYLIPDKILLPSIGIAFTYRLFENLINWNLVESWPLKIENFHSLFNYIFASLIAFVFFLIIFLVSRGRWIGFGDCKIVILLGLLLGFPNILVGLFLAFFFGAIIGLGLMMLGKKGLKSEIPFAPFLITGTFVAMFFGDRIIQWYMSLIFNFQ